MKTYNFSVIIPVFNVEKYLKKCLDSIVNQTYSHYEVIIVCDKCTDDSEEIVDEYVKKYKWNKIYEENTGLAKARNIGIENSKNDYLIFLDSDDYLESDFLEIINNSLVDEPDVLRFQVQDRIGNKIVKYNEEGFDTMQGVKAFDYIIKYHYIENAWAYCYKRTFWQDNNFKFMEGCIAEDYGLTPLVIAKANTVKSITYIGYNYVQRENSLMNNNVYSKKIKKMEDMLKQAKFEKKCLNIINDNETFLRFINNSLIYYSTTLKYKDYKKYNKLLKKDKCYSTLKGENLKSSIRVFLIKFNSYIFYNYIVR